MATFDNPSRFITISAIISWRYDCPCPRRWRCITRFPSEQRGQKGCVLVSTLFSMMFLSCSLVHSIRMTRESAADTGQVGSFSTYGDWMLRPNLKVNTNIIRDLFVADNCALNANSEFNMQHITQTKFLSPWQHRTNHLINNKVPVSTRQAVSSVKCTELSVENVTYLGSTFSIEVRRSTYVPMHR